MAKLPILILKKQNVLVNESIKLQINEVENKKIVIIAQNEVYKGNLIVSLKQENNDNKKLKNYSKISTLCQIEYSKDANDSIIINLKGINKVKVSSIKLENNDNIFIASFSKIRKEKIIENQKKEFNKKIKKLLSHPRLREFGFVSRKLNKIKGLDIIDLIISEANLDYKKRQEFLEIIDLEERIKFLFDLIDIKMNEQSVLEEIDNNIKDKFDSQQKEMILRERMKAIKKELGSSGNQMNLVDVWKEKIQEDRFPQHVKEKVLEEIERYEEMPSIAAESHIIRTYIELIIKLPWNKFSPESDNLDKAIKILEKNHYGLKKIKERIIEYLAVKMKTKRNNAPIMTLIGPPGVGKTSLAASIAQALNRKLIKISLGGVKDESEIRGHRRTYVGALPGKIVNALKKAGVSNPVILLDEIDKMASDFRGDPTSAMLEVLDPEQNKKFQDHYIELEYDLSNVMFVATANYYANIPKPLLDRVELIGLNQYTSEEKIQIAKKHIINDVINENNLEKNLFKISDQNILFIINNYTMESGVRELKRIFEKLARKIVLMQIRKTLETNYELSKENIINLLGKEKYIKEKLSGKSEIGLTNGMYYSSVGGGILPIEVTIFPSKKGGVKLTGSIEKVMDESSQVAIGYLRSNAKKLKLNNFDWEENQIQIHVPSGAIPKDGPSAGIAFTTAIASAILKKSVPKDIALTGEITLRGNVYEIGGLKEKTIGAVEAGIKTIFIPKRNEKDIPELSKKVKKIAKIISVDQYEEVYNYIFK